MILHPDYPKILARLTSVRATASPWQGDLFRMADPRFSSDKALLDGQGGQKADGRWNLTGHFHCTYTADSSTTAQEEALIGTRRKGFPDYTALPRVLVALRLHAQHVLDLTQGTTRKRAGIGLARIRTERWWSENNAGREAITQAIGRAAFSLGFEAILAPSAATPHGIVVLVFPTNLATTSRWEVLTPVSF